MIRRVALGVGVMVMAMSTLFTAVGSAGDTETRVYLDEFDKQRYSGNNGTHRWDGPWTEIGAGDGPTSGGAVYVWPHNYCSDGNCLKIGGAEVNLDEVGVMRTADLSGAVDAKLCFDMRRQLLGEESSAKVLVAISPDGGDSWEILDRYRLDRDDARTRKVIIDVTKFATADTTIAFIGIGGWASSYITFDSIELAALVPLNTTTTTTTPATTTTTVTTVTPSTTTAAPPTTTTTTTPPPHTVAPATTIPDTIEAPSPPNVATPDDAHAGGDNDNRFVTKRDMPATSMAMAIGAADPRPAPERTPIQMVTSTVQIAAAGIRSYALEAFFLGLFVAWLSLRGLSSTEAGEELAHEYPDDVH